MVPGGEVKSPEVVEGSGSGGAAAEDEHGEGPIVVDGRVRIALGDLLAVVAVAAVR